MGAHSKVARKVAGRSDSCGSEPCGARLMLIVLARAVAVPDGARATEIWRDVAALCALRDGAAALRPRIDAMIDELLARGHLRRQASVLQPTGSGRAALASLIRRPAEAVPATWERMRDEVLLPLALGHPAGSPGAARSIATVEALHAAILIRAFDLKVTGRPTAERLRNALAVKALERAFDPAVAGAFGTGGMLSAKAARLLAARLLKAPLAAALSNDQRLIAALAAEQVAAGRADLATLRVAVMGAFLTVSGDGRRGAHSTPASPAPALARPATPARSAEPPDRAALAQRPRTDQPAAKLETAGPDAARFVPAVLAAAASVAEGWPGSRRALITDAWRALAIREPGWRLSEAAFKALLLDAHRTGRLALATADLKDPSRLPEIQASAIAYKNAVWHFVRVEA